MRIGIDISQIVYEGTGVASYVRNMVTQMIRNDEKNSYVLFGASLRKRAKFQEFVASLGKDQSRVRLVSVPVPPTILNILWNGIHIIPVEWLVGNVDVFWSSDWTQPPLLKAKGVTTIHDLTVIRFPESFAPSIVAVQKRRLSWAKEICDLFLCDSKATQADVVKLLGIPSDKTRIVYPGFSL